MRLRRQLLVVGSWTAFLSLTLPGNALAYLDPGSGSYLFQMVVAGALGAMLTMKMYWSRLKMFFQRKLASGEVIDEMPAPDAQDQVQGSQPARKTEE